MTNSPRKQTVREADFSDYLRQQLEQETAPLPQPVVQGLRQARREALAQRSNRQAAHSKMAALFSWKPMASFATAAVLVLTVSYINLNAISPSEQFLDPDMDAELLFSDEGFQFYEDLEFYRWLANNNL